MSQFDDDEEDEIPDFELFDISDVEISIKNSRSRREVTFIIRSQSDFNLVKIYLSLKDYVEQMEQSMNIMEAAPETH